jgi:hypothetical protein
MSIDRKKGDTRGRARAGNVSMANLPQRESEGVVEEKST